MLKESLLAAAMSLPAWYGDKDKESPAEREARMEVIAQAIDDAVAYATCQEVTRSKAASEEDESPSKEKSDEEEKCKPIWRGSRRELAFLLLGQAYYETRFALHVHQGKCRVEIGECDGGLAISLWQLQSGRQLPIERWRTLSGTDLDSTRESAIEAARALARGRNYCKGSIEGAVAAYATGRSCQWKQAAERVRFVRKLQARYP